MAIYRQVHTTIWKDDWIGELSLTEKALWFYLLTNDRTTQCGIYDFSWRYATFETGISQSNIQTTIEKFQSDGKVAFNPKNNEIMIVNWLKYNSARSPKVAPVIDKELKEVKTLEFESEVIKKCEELGYPIKTKLPDGNTLSIPYQYNSDTILQPSPSSSSEPSPTPSAAEKGASATTPLQELSEFYQKNFGLTNPTIEQDLEYSLADFDGNVEIVEEAMKRAARDQKGFRYALGIMKKWRAKNIKTMEKVKAEDVQFENNQANKFSNNKPQKSIGVTPAWLDDKKPKQPAEQPVQAIEEQKQSIADKLAKLNS
ncbi:DnaD domain-containing protein [Lapidilactobacillus dextrinicus]|uniref:DnaD domain-containing protein n=1 Tax=Lapidilactobacillus dextrinicus TaxID=51664 RepID=UPI003F1F909C